jgi:O-acetyl-ADP-ribose deacetylase (regulator of RNase III)
MPYREYKGNLFASKAQTLVNTVNCVGVMGKGVALEFRRRFPEMFEEYRKVCASRLLRPGQILPYTKQRPWILNFAVKDDWRYPSKIEWVESCLQRFVKHYHRLRITSVSMPWIGAMNGRLPWEDVHALIHRYLGQLSDVDIELVEFDPTASDPFYEALQSAIDVLSAHEFASATHLNETVAANVISAVRHGQARNLTEVINLDGLGEKSIDRLYSFLRNFSASEANLPAVQRSLL